MSNHTCRSTLAGPPRRIRPALSPARRIHYDPRTLDRTETPLRAVVHQCARCHRTLPPDEATRDLAGDFVCQAEEECAEQIGRNARGGW